MSYIGIGYIGEDTAFLRELVLENEPWLKGDRTPRFFGNNFIVMYDSNTAREFAEKCRTAAPPDSVFIFPMERPIKSRL